MTSIYDTRRRKRTMLLYNFSAGPSRSFNKDTKSSWVSIRKASPSMFWKKYNKLLYYQPIQLFFSWPIIISNRILSLEPSREQKINRSSKITWHTNKIETYMFSENATKISTIGNTLYKLDDFFVRPTSRICGLLRHNPVQSIAMFRPSVRRIRWRIVTRIINRIVQVHSNLLVRYT